MSFSGLVAPFFVSVTLIFGLLHSFVAGEVWRRHADSVQVVRSEGDALVLLAYLTPDTDPAAAKLRAMIRAYAQSVVRDEWPRMKEGKHVPEAVAAFTSLLSAIAAAPASGSDAAAIQRVRLDTALKLHTLRGTRIALASDRTDEIKWATLLILGLVAQIAIGSVHLDKTRPQIAALTIFSTAAVIALGLVAIQERPFSAPLEVSVSPFEEVIREIPAR
jgi:hypothetical protein